MIRRAFWLIVGAVWLVVGAGLLVGGLVAYQQQQQFEAEGQVAEGMVLTKSIDRATRGTGGDTARARFDPARPAESLWVGRLGVGEPGAPGTRSGPCEA